tara:strand:- start:9 stop:416 length:408 start_codon:yes stop_codon:yes gene_type:complete
MAQKITVDEYRNLLIEEIKLLEKVVAKIQISKKDNPRDQKKYDRFNNFRNVLEDKKWEATWLLENFPKQWGKDLTELMEELELESSDELKRKIKIVKNLIFTHQEDEFLLVDLRRREIIMKGLDKFLQVDTKCEN